MTENKFNIRIIYPKWSILIVSVIVASLLIGFMFNILLGTKLTIVNVMLPSILNTVILWTGCTSIVIFTWKKFPWESRPGTHVLVETGLILLLLAAFVLCFDLYLMYSQGFNLIEGVKAHSNDIVFTVLITFLITTIHEAVFFYRQWKFNFSKSIILEKDNIEAQYNALKSQVNPHFLFNSLNSLMSLLDENPKAEQYVQDLSDFLRYVLLSNMHETVSLHEELSIVEKYIHLQKLRFGDNFDVEISINPKSKQMHIPPLALQMLLENCFKHNVISKSKPLHIKIFDNTESITIHNNLQKLTQPESTGQGLKNIEGRYRFVQGDGVKVVSDENNFSVTIPLISAL